MANLTGVAGTSDWTEWPVTGPEWADADRSRLTVAGLVALVVVVLALVTVAAIR